jgi:hypothetical protein
LFAFASLIIAIAPHGFVVVGARALQGLGAAFAVAGTLAAVTEAAAEEKRAGAIGAWTGFLMLGFSIGPLVGGALTHYAGWRANFWLNVLAMVPAGLALWLNPGTGERRKNPVDWLGLGLLAIFMVTLISGLHALPAARSAPGVPIILLALAAIALAVLIWAETRHHRPLLDFGLFADRNFALASGLVFLLMFDIMALLLYYNLFAQSAEGLGMTAIAAGLSLVPLSAALFGFARAAPRIGAALGLRTMMVVGSLLLALGCAIAWMSQAGAGFAMLMLGLFAAGAGIAALCISPAHRPRNAGADADRQGFRRPQLVQLSRRDRGRHLRWNRVRAGRLRRRACAGGVIRAGRRSAVVAAASNLNPHAG